MMSTTNRKKTSAKPHQGMEFKQEGENLELTPEIISEALQCERLHPKGWVQSTVPSLQRTHEGMLT